MAEKRIALVGIIVEDPAAVARVNGLLHEFSEFVIGRMGLPCRQYHLSIISIVLAAPPDVVSALSGKLGTIPGVSVKSLQSKTLSEEK